MCRIWNVTMSYRHSEGKGRKRLNLVSVCFLLSLDPGPKPVEGHRTGRAITIAFYGLICTETDRKRETPESRRGKLDAERKMNRLECVNRGLMREEIGF